MRIKNTLKNSIYGICSFMILAVLSFAIRKVFLRTLSVEILGYEGLFGNVFALISLADLGMETVILYRLFPAFANDNHEEINKILAVYKYLYRVVGWIVLVVGIALIPFLRLLISEGEYNWSFVYAIYIIQLLMTLASYFLAYKRIIFNVSQRQYECTKIDLFSTLVFSLLKLLALLLLKSYYLYLLCNLANNLLCNVLISRKAEKAFPFYNAKQKITRQDIRNLNIGKDIKNNLVQKLCGVIYGSTDSIVITATIGVANVGLLANYSMLLGYVQKILDKLLDPLQMSIGNYVHSEDQEKGLQMFRMFDFLSFFLASIVVSGFFCLMNPAVAYLFGEKYLLSQGFIAAFCINQYINWNHHILCFYRSTLGHYEMDKFPIAMAAVLNIVVSIVLSKPLGMAGIMLGTAVGHMGFWYGRFHVVYTLYIHESKQRYLIRQIWRLVCCTTGVAISYYLCRGLPVTLPGLLIRFAVASLIPCIVNFLVFRKTTEMSDSLDYLKKIKGLFEQRAIAKTTDEGKQDESGDKSIFHKKDGDRSVE